MQRKPNENPFLIKASPNSTFDILLKKATVNNNLGERDDIREIQFYTEDDVFIPSTTKIRELEVDKVKAKIYAREKILELLRYYGKKDVYELWDTLIRRLEFLREKVSWLIKELDTTIEKSHAIIDNWW